MKCKIICCTTTSQCVISRLAAAISTILILVAFVLVIYAIVQRYFLNSPLLWSDELLAYVDTSVAVSDWRPASWFSSYSQINSYFYWDKFLMLMLLIFSGLIAMLLTGMPIFAALGLAASIILLVFEGSISSIGDTVFSHLNKDLLTTIPLFVLMAQILIKAKVIDDLYDFANTVVGHIKGGLGIATVLPCTIFAAVSGSSVATAFQSVPVPYLK